MTLSKISVGAIWFCGVGYLVLRNYLPRIKADLRHAGLLMAMLAVIVVVIGLASTLPDWRDPFSRPSADRRRFH